MVAMRFIVWVALRLGRPSARALLYLVALYFWMFSIRARRASRHFLARVLDRPVRARDTLRHFMTFASTVLDRVFLLNDQYTRFEVRVEGEELMTRPEPTKGAASFSEPTSAASKSCAHWGGKRKACASAS